MMAKATIPGCQWDDKRHVDRECAVNGRPDDHGRAHATLFMSHRQAEVHHPDLPRRQSQRARHWLYSGYSSAADGSPSPATLSVNRASA